MVEKATFVSVWDDGAFTIESECEVDFDLMEIVSMNEAHVAWDEDGNPTYDDNEIDIIFNTIEHLDFEYVTIDGELRYTAASAMNVRDVEDGFGNGIIIYRQ